MEWKLAVTELLFIMGAIAPLYHLVLSLIKLERAAVIQRSQILSNISFLEKRVDAIDEWRSENSGLRLK